MAGAARPRAHLPHPNRVALALAGGEPRATRRVDVLAHVRAELAAETATAQHKVGIRLALRGEVGDTTQEFGRRGPPGRGERSRGARRGSPGGGLALPTRGVSSNRASLGRLSAAALRRLSRTWPCDAQLAHAAASESWQKASAPCPARADTAPASEATSALPFSCISPHASGQCLSIKLPSRSHLQ